MATARPGVIVKFDVPDGLGRVRLDDGTEARVSMSSMRGVVPTVGARVTVGDLVPHPLGGFRRDSVDGNDTRRSVDRVSRSRRGKRVATSNARACCSLANLRFA